MARLLGQENIGISFDLVLVQDTAIRPCCLSKTPANPGRITFLLRTCRSPDPFQDPGNVVEPHRYRRRPGLEKPQGDPDRSFDLAGMAGCCCTCGSS